LRSRDEVLTWKEYVVSAVTWIVDNSLAPHRRGVRLLSDVRAYISCATPNDASKLAETDSLADERRQPRSEAALMRIHEILRESPPCPRLEVDGW